MSKKFRKTVAFIAILAFLAATTSSCNRGVGCPNNFSIENGIQQVLEVVK